MALGATPARVVRDLMSESVCRLLFGVAIGLIVFLARGRLAASLIYPTTVLELGVLAFAVAPLVVLAGRSPIGRPGGWERWRQSRPVRNEPSTSM